MGRRSGGRHGGIPRKLRLLTRAIFVRRVFADLILTSYPRYDLGIKGCHPTGVVWVETRECSPD
jgi:hypothetical protein